MKISVFRVEKNREFTVSANCVFKDKTLSAKAKGILVEMLSLPDNWDYTLKGLTTLFSDGIDSIRQGIRELEAHGYVVRQRKRDSKGRLGGMEYVIYEIPHRVEENMPDDEGENTAGDPVDNSVGNSSETSASTLPAWVEPTAGRATVDVPAEGVATTYKERKNKELNISITNQSIK